MGADTDPLPSTPDHRPPRRSSRSAAARRPHRRCGRRVRLHAPCRGGQRRACAGRTRPVESAETARPGARRTTDAVAPLRPATSKAGREDYLLGLAASSRHRKRRGTCCTDQPVDDSSRFLSAARSFRFARRIALAIKRASHLENPAGVPRFRSVIRVAPSDVVSQV
jgi:hypothetical protein